MVSPKCFHGWNRPHFSMRFLAFLLVGLSILLHTASTTGTASGSLQETPVPSPDPCSEYAIPHFFGVLVFSVCIPKADYRPGELVNVQLSISNTASFQVETVDASVRLLITGPYGTELFETVSIPHTFPANATVSTAMSWRATVPPPAEFTILGTAILCGQFGGIGLCVSYEAPDLTISVSPPRQTGPSILE